MGLAYHVGTLIEWISEDRADTADAPHIIVHVTLRIRLNPCNGNLFLHELLGNAHISVSVKGKLIDMADHGSLLFIDDQMPLIRRVSHQTIRRCPSAELTLTRTGHDPGQHFL